MPQGERQGSPLPTLATSLRSSREGWEDGAEYREFERSPDLVTFARIHGIEVESFMLITGTDGRWVSGLRRRGGPLFATQFTRTQTGRPLIADILASLAKDAAAVETSINAYDWSWNVGIPSGQPIGQKYLTARLQARRLRAWLPVGSYETLLWDVQHT